MSGGVEINTETLRTAGTGLSQVCERLGSELDQLSGKVQSYAGAWGNDQYGQLIGAAVEEVVAYMFDRLKELATDFCERATDLGGMADWYDQAEQQFIDAFKALSDQLGLDNYRGVGDR
jgi:hypothetical protein